MSASLAIALAIIIVILLAVAAWMITRQQRRSQALRRHYGPEYEHTVQQYGDSHKAEQALEARAERVEQLHIRPLAPDQRARCAAAWQDVQTQFVDDPEAAIGRADQLIGEVMQQRGYPMGNFEQRAADVSVDHPRVVEHYRAAHHIASQAARREASTEDLRQAMVHYRTLFEELIESEETRQPAGTEVRR